ncbi:MAG: glycosyltransferase [Aggregatilineales bacterium]
MNIAYLANIRLPTEKAHGLQIMQMCEAFAQQPDVTLTLYAARRLNTPELAAVQDVWLYYGVTSNFALRRVPCLDLLRWLPGRVGFAIQTLTYLFALGLTLHFHRADVYYSRDPLTLLMLSLFVPRRQLCYEAHQLSTARWQKYCVRRVGTVVAVTAALAEQMKTRGATSIVIAHDGFRTARFANLPDQSAARRTLHWPEDAFIVGYVGRLQTMGISKGVETLIDAIARLSPDPVALCLLGGPDDQGALLRKQWLECGLAPELFLYGGAVAADRVPLYITAFDVCAMPLPWTEHFAYYASALKLFEYMAAGRALLATDLPGTAEVVRDNYSALLVKAGDPDAMADGLRRLKADPDLRARLATQAQRDVAQYAWDRRAARIMQAITRQSDV